MITDSLCAFELSADEERELIRAAKEKVTFGAVSVPSANAQAAKERLLAAYSPVINRMAKVHGLDWDELEAELIEAFLRSIEEYDFQSNNRLSHEIRFRFMAVTRKMNARQSAFTIPSQTRALFYSIYYKHAGGSWTKALEILGEFQMSRETFVAIADSLNVMSLSHVDRLNEGPIWNGRIPDFELVEFVKWLKSCLNDRELLLIDLHYGLDNEEANRLRLRAGHDFDEPISIPQVASIFGQRRETVWRNHNAAMDKMRRMIHAEA